MQVWWLPAFLWEFVGHTGQIRLIKEALPKTAWLPETEGGLQGDGG